MSSLSTGSPRWVEEKPSWSMPFLVPAPSLPNDCSAIVWHCRQTIQSCQALRRAPCLSDRTCPLAPSYTKASSSPDEGCGSGRSAALHTGARSARRAGRDRSVRLPGPTGDPARRRPGLPPGPGNPAPGAPAGTPLDLPSNHRFTIGRLSSSDLTVDQPTVSRQHAVMFQHGGTWYVADSNSTDGILVNRVPVVGRFVSRAPTRSAPERSYDCASSCP